jgi:hypothetical protein
MQSIGSAKRKQRPAKPIVNGEPRRSLVKLA